jgi:hypothetical protein
MDTYTYRQAADQAWTRITNLTEYGQYTVYEQFDINGFWHQANALLTCLDYLLNTNQEDNLLTNPNLQDKSIVKNAIQWVFVKHLFNITYKDKLWPVDPSNPNWPLYPWDPSHQIDFSQLTPIWTAAGMSGDGPWLDDFGWWGLALQKAYENADALGYDQSFSKLLLTMADACWEALRGTWDTINGGAYNSQARDKYGQPVALTGKNCVTNETLWLLSQCLHTSDPDQSKYVDQNRLSQKWFLDAYQNDNLLSKDNLVLERPKDIPNGMLEDWTWIGDQGLFILACTGSKGAGGDDLGDLARQVLAAVGNQLRDSSHVIHDHNVPILFQQYTLDYATGKGIYLRCFPPQQEFLPNATFVWKTCKPAPIPNDPDPSTKQFQFCFNWNPKGRPYDPNPKNPNGGEPDYLPYDDKNLATLQFSLLILQVAGMAALNVGVKIAPDQPIS